jgi:hypothetical protein
MVCNKQWLTVLMFLAARSSVAFGDDQIIAALEHLHAAVERGCDVSFDATYDFPGYGKARYETRFATSNNWIFVTLERFEKGTDPAVALEQMIWRDGVRVSSYPRLKDGHITIIKSPYYMLESANWFLESCFIPYNEAQKNDAKNSDYWLPFAIRNRRSEYLVTSDEVVEGVSCKVLERLGYDRLWVCPTMNFAIVKREFRTGPGNPVLVVTQFRDHREVEPGVWLPYSITRKLSGAPSWVPNGMDENAPASELSIAVKSLRLGPVPKDLFSMPSENTQYVTNLLDKRSFPVATDPQVYLDRVIQEMEHEQPKHRSWSWGIVAASAAVTITALAFVWRYINARR